MIERLHSTMFSALVITINFLLWLGCEPFGKFQLSVYISIVAAQALGAMLLFLFLQTRK